jgi:L-galactose dehydrogenase
VLQKRNIGLVGAAPVHMGILTTQGPQPWHLAQPEIKEAGRKVVALCQSRGVDPAIVAIRFSLDHSYIASMLSGMARIAEVEQNLKALDFKLDENLRAEIDRIVAPVQGMIWPSGRPENND